MILFCKGSNISTFIQIIKNLFLHSAMMVMMARLSATFVSDFL